MIVDKPELAPEVYNHGLDLLKFAPIPHWENVEYGKGLNKVYDILAKKEYDIVTYSDREAVFVIDDLVEII